MGSVEPWLSTGRGAREANRMILAAIIFGWLVIIGCVVAFVHGARKD